MEIKTIGIIDADLIGNKKHRFPNLASMKISQYHKQKGHYVFLVTDYENLDVFDRVYISKVFTKTEVPKNVLDMENVIYGGTGFYYDKAKSLPEEIEHTMPDYSLYNEWIEERIKNGENKTNFKYYKDYSIGYLTRGCFRKCKFCVNQKYNKVVEHSPLREFCDKNRKKICLLDDNFLGFKGWKEKLTELQKTGKPFVFKQGLDERLLTEQKCKLLSESKYDGDIIFSFDNIEDAEVIEKNLKMLRRYTEKNIKLYVLVGFKSTDIKDVRDMFERIYIIMKNGCVPYIMRYRSETCEPWKQSEYKDIYTTVSRWCNQPPIFKTYSFREFCIGIDKANKYKKSKAMLALEDLERKHPEIAKKYFDIKYPYKTKKHKKNLKKVVDKQSIT